MLILHRHECKIWNLNWWIILTKCSDGFTRCGLFKSFCNSPWIPDRLLIFLSIFNGKMKKIYWARPTAWFNYLHQKCIYLLMWSTIYVQLPIIIKYIYNYSVEFKDYTLFINDMKYYNAFFNYYFLITNERIIAETWTLFTTISWHFWKKRTIANISFIKKWIQFEGVNYDAVWALVTNSIHFPRYYIEIFICI